MAMPTFYACGGQATSKENKKSVGNLALILL
jgi:hypothetical protein